MPAYPSLTSARGHVGPQRDKPRDASVRTADRRDVEILDAKLMQLGGQDAQQVRMGGPVVHVHEVDVDVGTGNPDLRAHSRHSAGTLPGATRCWSASAAAAWRTAADEVGPEPGEGLGEAASDVGGEVENTNVGHVEAITRARQLRVPCADGAGLPWPAPSGDTPHPAGRRVNESGLNHQRRRPVRRPARCVAGLRRWLPPGTRRRVAGSSR